ncbi:MAG TPA: DEAD/DEAH box helicase [Leptospiraceae bacterium]|nr:DEAD/DEAH box helicase [Leptospiraceae bacterium]
MKDEIKALGAKWNKPVEKKWSLGSKSIPIDLVRFVDRNNLQVDPQLEDRFLAIRKSLEAANINLEHLKATSEKNLKIFIDKPTMSGKTLMKHQKEFLKEFVNNDFNILNALFVGGGKSKMSIIAAKLLESNIVLVVPPSLFDNWQNELTDCLAEAEMYSYAKMPEVVDGNFVLICDEAHLYQSMNSQRTQKMLNLSSAPNCLGTILLTGTPMRNGEPRNILPLLTAIKHPVAKNRTEFEIRYCEAGPTRFTKWDTSGSANLDELYEKTKNSIFTRNRKDCLDLPEFTRVFKDVEPDSKVLSWYQNQLRKLKADFYRRAEEGEIKSFETEDGRIIPMAKHLAFLSYARRLSSYAKIPYTLELIDELTKDGSQVIVFTWFNGVAEEIAKRLNCNSITGKTPKKNRQPFVDAFQNGENKVICNTFGAGGVGLNMQAGDYLILVDRDHVPAYYEQAEGRAYRAGRTQPVTSIWLNATFHDVDRVIDQIILDKQERIDLVMKGKRKSFKRLDTFESLAPDLLGSLFDFE